MAQPVEYGVLNEQIAPANGIELAYDVRGDKSDPALLLVCGLGSQMIFWDNQLCDMLAERGFYVIRYDNRDNGHSTILKEAGVPDQVSMMLGIPRNLAYGLDDMAADGMGLLDHLGIDQAHIWGVSMGGMIVQTMAIHHSGRILSMCSTMSRTGSFRDSMPGPKQLLALMRVGPDELEPYLKHSRHLWETIGSPGFPRDYERLDGLVTEAFNRGLEKAGSARQLHAINCQPNRKKDLQKLDIPTLVMHGSADRLVYPRGGRATAQAVPNSRLRIFEGMGHDLPPQLWPQFVAEIASNANRAVAQPVAA